MFNGYRLKKKKKIKKTPFSVKNIQAIAMVANETTGVRKLHKILLSVDETTTCTHRRTYDIARTRALHGLV